MNPPLPVHTPSLSADLLKIIIPLQRAEMTEHSMYDLLSSSFPEGANRSTLQRMADQELHHHDILAHLTGSPQEPDHWQVRYYFLLTRIFGLCFGIHLMERREAGAIEAYKSLLPHFPDLASILEDEEMHEEEILTLLEDDRLHYIGSVVLGLSDAIVEFTGTLAGLTLALQDSRLVALAGLITGVAAALSMGASEYLARRTDPGSRIPRRAAAYTGISYIVTVLILVLPYLLITNPLLALPFTLSGALVVILFFTYYTSVAQNLPFGRRFLEMAAISMGVAGLSFLIGILIRFLIPASI